MAEEDYEDLDDRDPAFRQKIYEIWKAEWEEAKRQLADINNSPYYGNGDGWRVD